MHLTELPYYRHLSEEEKRRLHQIHQQRVEQGYNVEGEASISQEELKRANMPDLLEVEKEALDE